MFSFQQQKYKIYKKRIKKTHINKEIEINIDTAMLLELSGRKF